jgi:hypothetical protein
MATTALAHVPSPTYPAAADFNILCGDPGAWDRLNSQGRLNVTFL